MGIVSLLVVIISVGIETGNAGKHFVATQKQILADYSAIGALVPGGPKH